MERYENLNGDSSVRAYEIRDNSIRVQFSDGSIYLYTYRSAGCNNIETMKTLARDGRGLNSFIIRYVSKAYAVRWIS